MKVAFAQLNSNDQWEENKSTCLKLLKSIENNDVKVVFFPENALYMRLNRMEPIAARSLSSQYFDDFRDWAVKNNCAVVFGSVATLFGNEIYNATIAFETNGMIWSPYQKIHLFDVQLSTGENHLESSECKPGGRPSIWTHEGWSFGLSICYDLRFSELYSHYGRVGVDAILVPSAFTVPTGQAHWHVLLRARAIENQCYVIAPAQAGDHELRRKTFGHSMVIEPWGDVVKDLGPEGVSIEIVQLEKEKIQSFRHQIPMKSHRRL